MVGQTSRSAAKIGARSATGELLVSLGLFLMVAAGIARGETLTVLHSFAYGADGAVPFGGVIMDRAGNLYGTTMLGGSYNHGTIYKIDSSGNTTILHEFRKHDGSQSEASLLMDTAGNLYGTTSQNGSTFQGTTFELRASGRFIVLHTFEQGGGYDGEVPVAGLVRDAVGNLYGTTVGGGRYQQGAVFKIDHGTGVETVLHSFANVPDGSFPAGSLLLDSQGNLYGTTQTGGSFGAGTVFKIDSSGSETVLYNFAYTDGQSPTSNVIGDAKGNLYGTTYSGGVFGLGTVFRLDPSGVETVLHDFDGNGANPYGGLIRDNAGSLYGTTYTGGAIFKLDPSGTFTILHYFNGADGGAPRAGLIHDSAGNLYGTTTAGGDFGWGVVYKFSPN